MNEGSPAWLILPALSAFFYVVSAICIKRAIVAGAGQSAVNFAVNLLAALMFQPLWFMAGEANWELLWMPAIAAVTFSLGQIFTFVALRHGDVSLATPLLGVKVIFTVIFAALLFGEALSIKWWIAASAGTLGVIFVTGAKLRNLLPCLLRPDALAALTAAACFAVTDVFVQRWAPQFGVNAFIALMFGGVGFLSTIVFTVKDGIGVFAIPKRACIPLTVGGCILGVQALGMALAIAMYGNAAAVNIVYASRSIWSIVLAWALARLWTGYDASNEQGTLRGRLLGSLLLIAAMLFVLL